MKLTRFLSYIIFLFAIAGCSDVPSISADSASFGDGSSHVDSSVETGLPAWKCEELRVMQTFDCKVAWHSNGINEEPYPKFGFVHELNAKKEQRSTKVSILFSLYLYNYDNDGLGLGAKLYKDISCEDAHTKDGIALVINHGHQQVGDLLETVNCTIRPYKEMK